MVKGQLALVLLGAWLGACGGRASDPNDRPATGGAGSGTAGMTEPSGAGGAGASSAGASLVGSGSRGPSQGGASSAGTSSAGPFPVTQAERACNEPAASPRGGGYVMCADGSLRRPRAAECASALPRSGPDTPLAFDECTRDTDCTEKLHGYCAYGACEYGCVSDEECPSDQACFCGAAIGSCVPAGCRSDADCPGDYPCTAFVDFGFSLPDAIACQSPNDECITTKQCHDLNPRVSCKVQVDQRVCFRDLIG